MELLQNQENQAGLEIDPRTSPPTYESTDYKEDFGHEEKRILGLKERFFIPAAVPNSRPTFTTTATTSITTQPPNTPTIKPDPYKLLQNSSIASANWTDGTFQHYAVFYQNKLDRISLSLWDEQNKTWSASDVIGNNIPSPKPSKSIATSVHPVSDSSGFQLNVYFYAAGYNIIEMCTKDQQVRADSWKKELLTSNTFLALPDSRLTTYYDYCFSKSCVNSTVLLYQFTDGFIHYINGANGWARASDTVIGSNIIGQRTGVALMPWGNLHAYVESKNQLQEYAISGYGLPLGWIRVSNFETAAGKFNLQNPSKIAAIPLTNKTPALSVALGNFTDIAMDHNRRFYGISDRKIH